MSPYHGDHIKKERDALNLIIRMKRADKSGGSELFFYVLVPLAMAFAIMHYRDILVYCYKTPWATAAIKVVYPAWKGEGDVAPAEPVQTAGGADGAPPVAGVSPGSPGAGTAPGTVEGSPDTPVSSSDQTAGENSTVPAVNPGAEPGPAETTSTNPAVKPAAKPARVAAPQSIQPAHTNFPSSSTPFNSEPLRAAPGSFSEPN